MKSPKFQVGEAVQTIGAEVGPQFKCCGEIKYRYYGIRFNGWYYIVRPNGVSTYMEEGIVYAERVLELSPPLPPSKFHKGQKVSTVLTGIRYFGKINCVINMKTHYDYYIDIGCGTAISTIRCNEKELCPCCCHCC